MCLIVFAWAPDSPQPLLLAANRDEFYARPTLPLAEWDDAPGVFAGRDLEAGGTWLGLTRSGRFAALTNIRDPGQPARSRSRGELTADYLLGDLSPERYLQQVMEKAEHYAGFNLLLGDAQQLWHYNPREGQPGQLQPGLYGLSNASLNTPWPKLQRARQALQQCQDTKDSAPLLALLADRHLPEDHLLPETGVGLATERLLSSAFIASAAYGTRASTALILRQDGWHLTERSFGPHGALLGEVSLEG